MFRNILFFQKIIIEQMFYTLNAFELFKKRIIRGKINPYKAFVV